MKTNTFSLFISFYLWVYKIHTKTVNLIVKLLTYTQIISEGFWLTILSEKAVMGIDNYHYNSSTRYFNEDYNRSLLNEWEADMVNRFFVKCKKIMVLASGGGREVYALLKKDFEVDGFECNKNLVKFSHDFIKKEGLNSTIEYVSPNHCPNNNRIYDGIILGWGAYNHVKGKDNRINLLKEINSHMEIDSPLLLSYWFSNENSDSYCTKIAKVNNFFCKIFFTKPIEKGDRLTILSGHFFTLQEVNEELSQAGFSVVYESGQHYGHTVAHKVKNIV